MAWKRKVPAPTDEGAGAAWIISPSDIIAGDVVVCPTEWVE